MASKYKRKPQYKKPQSKPMDAKTKKQLMIACIAAVVVILFFVIVPLDGSLLQIFGAVPGLKDNMITLNAGTSGHPKYFEVATIQTEIASYTLTEDTLKTDKNVQDFYYKNADEAGIIKTLYVTASMTAPAELAQTTHDTFQKQYGIEAVRDVTTGTIGGREVSYYLVAYNPTDEEKAKAAEADGSTLEPWESMAVYFEGKHGYTVVVSLSANIDNFEDLYSDEEMIACAEDVVKAISTK